MTAKKSTKKVEKKVEPKKKFVKRFGIFDQNGKHFIRCYSTKDFSDAKEMATGFISKESKATQKTQDRDEPKLVRTIVELTKTELAKWEETKRHQFIASENERIARATGQPRTELDNK